MIRTTTISSIRVKPRRPHGRCFMSPLSICFRPSFHVVRRTPLVRVPPGFGRRRGGPVRAGESRYPGSGRPATSSGNGRGPRVSPGGPDAPSQTSVYWISLMMLNIGM